MNLDRFGEFVKNALIKIGCDPTAISELDPHQTIEIALDGMPSMFVGVNEKNIMIWSNVCEYHESLMRVRADELLEAVMDGIQFGVNQQLMLRENSGYLQIWANVSDAYLENDELMGKALEEFFERHARFTEIVKQ